MINLNKDNQNWKRFFFIRWVKCSGTVWSTIVKCTFYKTTINSPNSLNSFFLTKPYVGRSFTVSYRSRLILIIEMKITDSSSRTNTTLHKHWLMIGFFNKFWNCSDLNLRIVLSRWVWKIRKNSFVNVSYGCGPNETMN